MVPTAVWKPCWSTCVGIKINESWMGANQNPNAVSVVLDATAGDNREGLSMKVMRDVSAVFKIVRKSQEQGLRRNDGKKSCLC